LKKMPKSSLSMDTEDFFVEFLLIITYIHLSLLEKQIINAYNEKQIQLRSIAA